MKRAVLLALVVVLAGTAVYFRQWPISLYMKVFPPHPDTALSERLAEAGHRAGDAVFIRIFKDESELEVWLAHEDEFRLFDVYPICRWSGKLGPKLKEGDHQAPEGFYQVTLASLNPNSRHHLSFNLGFPNAFDRSLGRTGSYLMVHGGCSSVGCYAMTDPLIDEIYKLVEAALQAGQSVVEVHAFPFRMDDQNLAKHEGSEWIGFWRNLKEGYDVFEETRKPPSVEAAEGRYLVSQR